MSSDKTRPDLDDILFEFVGAMDRPDWATVQQWMARYPYYAREISDFAAAWTLSEHMPVNPETEAIPLEHWTAIGLRAFERAVAEDRASYGASAALTSLIAAAKQQTLNANQLAEQTGLSRTLLMKLDQRLIAAATIPSGLVRRLADALNAPREAVAAYLAQPATLAAGVQYKAESAPTVQPQESFAQAVEADKQLKPGQRETLLAMTRDGDDEAT